MKLNQLKDNFYYFTGQLSKLTRQFAMIGIGVVWIFTFNESTTQLLLGELSVPIILFVLTLFFDLLQYLYGSIAWGILRRKYYKEYKQKEKLEANLILDNTDDTDLEEIDVSVNKKINYPTDTLFYLKVGSLILGYILLLAFMISNVIK